MIKICDYCGHYQKNNEDEFCECGGNFIMCDDNNEFYSWEINEVMANYEGDFYYQGNNNIDNILECKRAQMKRRDTYRIG